jgi:hypothetical protein
VFIVCVCGVFECVCGVVGLMCVCSVWCDSVLCVTGVCVHV